MVAGLGLVVAGAELAAAGYLAGAGKWTLVQERDRWCRKAVAGAGLVAAVAGKWPLVSAGSGRLSLVQEGGRWCRTGSCWCRKVAAGVCWFRKVAAGAGGGR